LVLPFFYYFFQASKVALKKQQKQANPIPGFPLPSGLGQPSQNKNPSSMNIKNATKGAGKRKCKWLIHIAFTKKG
jgi:hypothetical protein